MTTENFDADRNFKEYNKKEQDKKDLKEGLMRKKLYEEEDKAADKADFERDKEILAFFDIKFFGDPLENKYQLNIPKVSQESYNSRVFSALYIQIREERTVYKFRKNKPAKVMLEPDVPHEQYIKDLLDYHFNFCKKDKFMFLYKLKRGILDISKNFAESKTFKETIEGEAFYRWVDKKITRAYEKSKAKKLPGLLKQPKEVFNTLADAAMNDATLQAMFKVLLDKKAIDNDHLLTKTATLLYSLIKKFKTMGYFKKIFDKDLHLLVNKEFKIKTTYQTYKQADCYSKSLA